ncbi:MAG TPA: hypothetical protein VF623_10790 [Segetibacter sp.]
MTINKPKTSYRFLKRFIITAAVLTVLLFALQLWFVASAKSILKQYITEQSQGKIKLELSHLDLNLWTKHLQIHKADLLSTDSLKEPITYHVTFSRLSLKVGSVWGLLFKKELLLDSLKLYDPVIQVMQWRKDTAQVVVKDELSIPQEMGKVYNSLINALDEFAVRRIIIDNAKISLINKMRAGSEPVTVSNIFFDLARTPVKQGKKTVYLKNEQTISLKSVQQNIALPGGRHHLSFKSFNLRLFRKTIELDSCTVTAMATDSLKSSYKIFFKKLLLSGVDFTTLSTQNVIKADTVYCENPLFDVSLYRLDAVRKKTETPDPNKIIRELTGNLNLAFVAVKNAGINFSIYGKKKLSFFNSKKDNFEMEGFRINPDSLQPVTLKRFDMTLRDYHLYNEDSSASFGFDSLHFLNNKVVLNNFAMTSGSGKSKLRDKIDVKVPYFELSQLDWYQLIFEQNLVAEKAVLNHPVINLMHKKAVVTGKKVNLLAVLQTLDTLVALNNVSVLNGQVNIQLGSATSFGVENINLNLYSKKLLRLTTQEGLRNAIDHLSFAKGVLRLKNFTARLQNATYNGHNLIYADKVDISSPGNKIIATVNKVYIDNMQWDNSATNVEADGLNWQSADISLHGIPAGAAVNPRDITSIRLNNIAGNNTRLNFWSKPASISTFVQTIKASSMQKKGNNSLRAEGLFIAGDNLLIKSKAVKVMADAYKVSGNESSLLTGVHVEQINGKDSLVIRSPQVNFSADINDLLASHLHLTNVSATAPVIRISKWNTPAAMQDSTTVQPTVRIDKLTAIEPDITISTNRNDSVAVVKIPGSGNSMIKAGGINISRGGLQIESLVANTTAATYTKPTGEIAGVKKGKIDMDISNIRFDKKDGKMNWSGLINFLDLQNADGFQLGKTKNNIRFQQASLGNLILSSESLPDFNRLMRTNISAWMRIPQGQFVDSNKTIQWYNANYNNSTRTLSLDSFIYHPTQSLESTLAHAPYQLDYITLKTGSVAINGLDVARYEKDSAFIANTIKINHPVLTVHRDKKPPSSPFGKDKPLPVNMIKSIGLPVLVQSIQLDGGTITYSEKNKESRQTGNLFLTKVSGTIENIKNRDISNSDSLLLTFNASLMDSGDIKLNLKESYADSLSGFLVNTTMTAMDMTVLNPFIVPISNVKIESGKSDSVSFTAVGRLDVAMGEMRMYYHKLHIKFVEDGVPDKSSFAQKVISFVANTFVIKSNNTSRKGIIYYKHLTEQSFVNYIIKTTLSGIASSIGSKKNRKYIKDYKQEIKDSNLPRIKQ